MIPPNHPLSKSALIEKKTLLEISWPDTSTFVTSNQRRGHGIAIVSLIGLHFILPGNVVWHKTENRNIIGNIPSGGQWNAGEKTLDDCKQACQDDVRCKSLTYRDDECRLRSVTKDEAGVRFPEDRNFDYYEARSGEWLLSINQLSHSIIQLIAR